MTFRAKPVVKRTHRPSWERSDRKNLYTNIGFGLVVAVAVLILIGAVALTWYDAHLAPVASVNGQTITKDDYARRFAAEAARFTIAGRRLEDEFNAGRLTKEQLDSQKQFVQQRGQQLPQIVYERLIDAKVMAPLAAEAGITITAEDIAAQITKEATLPEQRHAWVIEVAPKVDEDKDEPTATQKADAKKIADKALADINGGKSWDEIAKAVSTGSTKALAGDLSWISEDSSFDKPWLDALFAVEANGMTAVVEGEDGTYRIGRVTEIAPERVVPTYRDEIAAEGVDLAFYESVVQADLISEKLNEKITAEALAAGPQREVKDILIRAGETEAVPTGSVKVRHILYSPKDVPDTAATVPADDPSWKKAEDEARAAYTTIKADITKFDEIARTESDEGGAETSGGKLPYFDPSQGAGGGGQLDQAFADAIFKPGLKAGDLLEPVKSQFGWHVIQVMYFPPDIDQASKLKSEIDGGADFAQLARDFSDGDQAAEGGDLGWVAKYQFAREQEDAIFGAPVGKVTDPIVVDGEGIHLFLVTKEETRTPEGDQKDALEGEAFPNWYAAKKATFDIKRELDFTSTGG